MPSRKPHLSEYDQTSSCSAEHARSRRRSFLPAGSYGLRQLLTAEAVRVDGSRRHPDQFPFDVVALAMVRLDQAVAFHAFQFSADLPGGERLDVEPKPPGAEPSA